MFKDLAPYLMQPLVLVGFVVFIFFGAQRALLKAGRIPPLTRRAGETVLGRLVRHDFVIALLVVLLGFALALYRAGREHDPVRTTSTLKQVATALEGGMAVNAGRDVNLDARPSPSKPENTASSAEDAPAASSVIQEAKAAGGGIAINAGRDANIHKQPAIRP